MGLLEYLGGFSPGFNEGGNDEIVEDEHHQDLGQISKHNFFGMEGQVERVWEDLVG